MTTTINAVTLKINSDTSDLGDAAKLIRKDINEINRVLRKTETSSEKLERQTKMLDRALDKGAISAKQHGDAIRRLREHYKAPEKGIQLLATRVKGFAKTALHPATLGLAAAATGFATMAAAARASVSAIQEAFGSIDNLAKTSSKLGLLSTELQGIRLAGEEMSGMAENTVDMALQRMTRRLAEAAAGTGEAKDAIKELGLDARRLNAAGPADAFKAIAEAIRNVKNPADQLRIAFKLFDSEGAAMVNTLRNGREGIEASEAAIRRMGLAFDSVDAAKVEAANDALGRVRKSLEGLATQAAISLAPSVERVAKHLTVMIRMGREGFHALTREAIRFATIMNAPARGRLFFALSDSRKAVEEFEAQRRIADENRRRNEREQKKRLAAQRQEAAEAAALIDAERKRVEKLEEQKRLAAERAKERAKAAAKLAKKHAREVARAEKERAREVAKAEAEAERIRAKFRAFGKAARDRYAAFDARRTDRTLTVSETPGNVSDGSGRAAYAQFLKGQRRETSREVAMHNEAQELRRFQLEEQRRTNEFLGQFKPAEAVG